MIPTSVIETVSRRLWAEPHDLDNAEKQLLLGTNPQDLIATVDVADLLLSRGGRAMPLPNLAQSLQQDLAPPQTPPVPKPLGQVLNAGRLFTNEWPDPVTNTVAEACVEHVARGHRAPLPLIARVALHFGGHTPMVAAATLAARMKRAGTQSVTFKELEDAIDEAEDALAEDVLHLLS